VIGEDANIYGLFAALGGLDCAFLRVELDCGPFGMSSGVSI
jgi:hypothetical protein